MMIARTVMIESGLGGRFQFKAASADKDARNVTFKDRVRMTQHQAVHGEKQDVSDFRAFSCMAWAYLDMQADAAPRKRKAHAKSQRCSLCWFRQQHKRVGILDLGRQENSDIKSSQVSEHEFPIRKRKMMDQFLSDKSTDMLYQHASYLTWVP